MSNYSNEILKYIVNGLVATLLHYIILSTNLNILNFKSAGLANLIAALFGITASFIGSRYYVFKKIQENIFMQASKFCLLYSLIAIIHGLILFIWSDIYDFDYRIGFIIAIMIQFILSLSLIHI